MLTTTTPAASPPTVVGIIFGEAIAAGVWLIINLCLAACGIQYRAITLLPV